MGLSHLHVSQGSILKGVVNKSLELTEVFDFEYRVILKLLFSYWLSKTYTSALREPGCHMHLFPNLALPMPILQML